MKKLNESNLLNSLNLIHQMIIEWSEIKNLYNINIESIDYNLLNNKDIVLLKQFLIIKIPKLIVKLMSIDKYDMIDEHLMRFSEEWTILNEKVQIDQNDLFQMFLLNQEINFKAQSRGVYLEDIKILERVYLGNKDLILSKNDDFFIDNKDKKGNEYNIFQKWQVDIHQNDQNCIKKPAALYDIILYTLEDDSIDIEAGKLDQYDEVGSKEFDL